jgi:hypothetical protein
LHDAPPDEWVISRICEEFTCLPSEAARELERDPQLVFDILELRHYKQTRDAILNAKDESQVPHGKMADLAADIEFEAIQERSA